MLALPNPTHWRRTKWFIQWARSQCFSANCVQQLAAEKPIYEFTFRSFTHPTLLSSVSAAKANFQIATATKFTRKRMKARNVIAVSFVPTLRFQLDIWSRTCWFTATKNRSNVNIANKPSAKSNCWSVTRTFITIQIIIQRNRVRRITTAQHAIKRSVTKATWCGTWHLTT